MKLTHLLAPLTLALLTSSVHADAVTVPATAGHAWTPGGPTPFVDTCFSNPAWDVVTNNCPDPPGTTHTWIIPMQVATSTFPIAFVTIAQGLSFTTTGFQNASTMCHAFATDSTNTQWFVSSLGFTPFTTPRTVSMGQLGLPLVLKFGVPAHGTVHFECTMGQGGRVLSAELVQ